MKIASILTIIFFAVSCGNPAAKKAKAPKRPVKFEKENIQAATTLDNHYKVPDTFTFFYFPHPDSINWSSKLFKSSDTGEQKLANIVAEVLKQSSTIDGLDKATYQLGLRNKEIEKLKETHKCEGDDIDDEIDIDIDEDIEKDINQEERVALCEKLDIEFEENNMKVLEYSATRKGAALREIEMAVDNVNYISEDEKEGLTVNWQDYDKDFNAYRVEVFGTKKPVIVFPGLGRFQNSYSSEKGEIYNIKMGSSKYNSSVPMLFFTMREKGEEGKFTGNLIYCELEMTNFLTKIRFNGDAKKVDKKGRILQEGAMKFEFAPKDKL